MTSFDDTAIDSHKARLAGNARPYRYDPQLDPIADAMDRGDTDAWTRLHPMLQDRASVYRDLRQHYRAAVQAGAIPDDRGPDAA